MERHRSALPEIASCLCRMTVFVAVLLQCVCAFADIIQDEARGGVVTYAGFQPGGPWFTATDDVVFLESIDVFWADVNTTLPLPRINVGLFEGVGFGGPIIASSSSQLLSAPPDQSFIEFDFSGVTLAAGEKYSIRITPIPSGTRGAYTFALRQLVGFDPYSGGEFINAGGSRVPDRDLTFRVIGSPIPEPSALALLTLTVVHRRPRRCASSPCCA